MNAKKKTNVRGKRWRIGWMRAISSKQQGRHGSAQDASREDTRQQTGQTNNAKWTGKKKHRQLAAGAVSKECHPINEWDA